MGLAIALRVSVDPPLPKLARRLTELYEPPPDDGVDLVRVRWRAWGLRAMRVGGGDVSGVRRDLRVCAMTMERHAAVKLGFALSGAVAPVAVAVLWTAAGIST